jgi:hypothetical protein
VDLPYYSEWREWFVMECDIVGQSVLWSDGIIASGGSGL